MILRFIYFILNILNFNYCPECGKVVKYGTKIAYRRNPHIMFGMYSMKTHWSIHYECKREGDVDVVR